MVYLSMDGGTSSTGQSKGRYRAGAASILFLSLFLHWSTSMTNITLNYNLEDLNIFTPELKGWRLYLFTVSSMATAIISLVIQITVYKSLKRMGPRHINQMIIPSQVSKIAIIDIWNFLLSRHPVERVKKYKKFKDKRGPLTTFYFCLAEVSKLLALTKFKPSDCALHTGYLRAKCKK